MGQSGGQTSGGTSTQQTKNQLPAWESPFAKEYLASLAALVYPGMTVPSNYIGQKGYNFGSGSGSSGSGSGGAGGTGSQAGQFPGLDSQLASQFVTPMLASSPYLQNQAQQNPASVSGQMSPAAFNQLAGMYTNLPKGKS